MNDFPLLFGALLGSNLYMIVVTIIAGAAIGYLIYQGDTRVEQRREHALSIAAKARENGFEVLPELLEAYAIGDYSKLLKEMGVQYRVFANDELRAAAYNKFLKRQLEVGLADPERREKIYAAVERRKVIDAAEDQAVVNRAKSGTNDPASVPTPTTPPPSPTSTG